MRRVVVMLVLVLAGMSFGLISPSLHEHLTAARAGQKLPVQIVLKEQFDKALLNSLVDGMPKPVRRVEVARILSKFSAQQQAGVLEFLATANAENVQSFWIVNAVYCEATPAVIQQLSERPEVSYVNYDRVYCPDLVEPAQETEPTDEIAWGVRKINAPAVWALGYTGQGIVCGHIDTGCNYNHPDLADHMWTDANYPHHGWNFESNNNDPMDVSGHGTHTSGTVAGDGTGGTQTGVAPDAEIMVCRVRTSVDTIAENQMFAALQFVVSPPLSPSHGADLYTMSLGWYISWNPHQATWRAAIDDVNAAGLSQIVAAGNERGVNTPPNACRCPGNVPPPWWNPENTGVGTLSGVVSIGATDSSDVIADFSSPGPVTWSGVSPYNDYPYPPGLTRPDVSAPGVDVKSCSYTGSGYTLMSGTSMATPHTAGVVCLMLSKNPNLSPAVVDSILELTAVDLGSGGKDNDYGAGRIDALAAVSYVTGSGGPMLSFASKQIIDSTGNNNGILDPSETAKLLITLRNSGGAGCDNVTGTFRTYDARLTMSDSTGAWGDIPSGGSVTNTADWFVIHADGAIPPGTAFTCSLFVHGDADYDTKMPVLLTVGTTPRQPGEIIWGPVTCPGMPTDWGLYGAAYNTNDNLLYTVYFMTPTIYKYSSDSLLTLQGTVTLPNDSCTDIDYITYDNAFWVVCNPQKIVYKISPSGAVLNQFSVSFADYPCGITEYEPEHKLYISDRRTGLGATQLIYVTDTLGNVLDTITHPMQSTYGTRCLALDGRCPSNPPSLLNIYTWFDASGTILDSCGMYELDRVDNTVLNGYVFPNTAWNIRGIECDPRDGSYWITIMQGGTTDNMIFKVVGFNYDGTGIEEPGSRLPAAADRVVVRAQPNPFTGSTNLSVRLPAAGSIDLKVYDNNGRVVRTLARSAPVTAQALFPWDGRNEKGETVAPGIYFYRVKSATAEAWGKVVLSR